MRPPRDGAARGQPRSRLALVLALSLLPVAAEGSAETFGDVWRWSHFTTTSGLPSNLVLRAVEIPGDGLWVVTRGGLARFDGYRWHPIPTPPTETGLPAGLTPDGSGGVVAVIGGRLFVGDRTGLRLVPVVVNGRELAFSTCARAARGPVLLLGYDRTMYEWDGRTCRRHEPSRALGLVENLRQAGPSGVWVAAAGGLSCWEGTRWRMRLPGGGAELLLGGVAEQADGSAMAYVDSPLAARGLWEWRGETGPRPLRRQFTSPVESVAMAPEGETVIVHGTGEVMVRSTTDWRPLLSEGIRIPDARAAGHLANHDLWVASDHGLHVQRRSSVLWRTRATPMPDDRNTINEIVRMPDGRILLATGRGVIDAHAGWGPDKPAPAPGEDIGAITGLAVDTRGQLWAGSGYSFRGARRRGPDGRWQSPRLDPLLDRTYVHRIVTDRAGGVWFLGLSVAPDPPQGGLLAGPGAFRLSHDGTGDRIERWGPDQGLPSGRVYAFDEGPDGSYWFGTTGGLSRWRQGRWRHWTTREGLQDNRVFTLAVDRSDVVWFGHQGGGLGRLEQDHMTYFRMADGLATDAIWTVSIDDRGRVWVGGEGGVSFLDQGTWTSFDERNGLISTRVWPILSVDNEIYLGTRGGGLAVLDLAGPLSPPPVVVPDTPAVLEGRVLLRWRAFAWWGEVDPDAVPTRVRLDDGPWTAWSTEREWQVFGLAPGSHVLSLQSKGLLGTVNGANPPVTFEVPKPLALRPVFYLPLGSLALVVVGLTAVLALRQRRHHRELHEREQRLATTFRAGPVAASITEFDDGRFLDVNEAFLRLSGWSRDELIGRTGADMGFSANGYDRGRTVDGLRAGRPLHGVAFKTRVKSGDIRDVLGNFEVVELGGHRAILSQFLDVTDQRRLEDQLRQAQKMESIGRLAGGVAHDFNNLLTVILGNAAFVDSELPEGDPRRAEIEQIKIACERAEKLTRQLLAFARKQVVQPRIVNVNDVVLRTDAMLRRLIGEDIELVALTAPDIDYVFIDPNQLDEALLNMAVNARDAMPSGGTLTIRASNVVISEQEARLYPDASPGAFVRLSVADTGVGMDAATLARIFEPFFTTKGPGKGTGLGLATCYGVVKQAGGHIIVESEPGRGATFHIDLPRAPASSLTGEASERPPEPPRGTETILVVEDEIQVRKLAAAILRQLGYTVLEASTAPEALQLADRCGKRLDLLVTDIVMPLMRGTDLAVRMRGIRPDLKVLFMSGYSDDDSFRREVGAARHAFLPKPFTPASLARKVRDVLDEQH